MRAHARMHWTELDEPVAKYQPGLYLSCLDPDGFVATVRGHQGGTWAHWQLALPYALCTAERKSATGAAA